MRIIKFVKTKIRVFILYFYNKTTNFIVDDLLEKIQNNKSDLVFLNGIHSEIRRLKILYPTEPEIIKAETIVTRLLVMKY